ncbi:hypothetical protein Ancab_020652 [Ancistrocladus abbreviatus]
MDVGSRVYGGSDHMTALLQNNHHNLSCSSDPIDSLWFPSSSPSFHDSMVNFDDIHGRGISSSPDVQTPYFRPRSREETGGGSGDDDFDTSFHHHPEKKRRLTAEQVQYLERSFEVENKLEPERKVQLAKELGLQPRQVAIWFQNRRARFKTKQLEKDYDLLKASYDSLKADYDTLLKEKENLKNEVAILTNKLKLKEKQMVDSDPRSPIDSTIWGLKSQP